MTFIGDLMSESWLRAYMFPASNKMTLTVKGVRKQQVSFDGNDKEEHTVMSFEEITPELTLSKVNIIPIIKMLGNDVKAWQGKRVTFFTTTEIMPHPMRKDEPCIRVYGSPDIEDDMTCEWTPPKRRKLVQKLKVTGLKAYLKAIKSSPVEKMPAYKNRFTALHKAGEVSDEDLKAILAEIEERR